VTPECAGRLQHQRRVEGLDGVECGDIAEDRRDTLVLQPYGGTAIRIGDPRWSRPAEWWK
jgi:hypothetical protein